MTFWRERFLFFSPPSWKAEWKKKKQWFWFTFSFCGVSCAIESSFMCWEKKIVFTYLNNIRDTSETQSERMQQRRFFSDGMALLRAAVLAAVLGQILGSVGANRPLGTHPGHAYFEQPCCGHSHLRHHKGSFLQFSSSAPFFPLCPCPSLFLLSFFLFFH